MSTKGPYKYLTSGQVYRNIQTGFNGPQDSKLPTCKSSTLLPRTDGPVHQTYSAAALMTKNRMNCVLKSQTYSNDSAEVSRWISARAGASNQPLPTDCSPLVHDKAVQLVRNCAPKLFYETYTSLDKVNAAYKTILFFKHYTRLLTTSFEVQKTGLHCIFFFLGDTSNKLF